MSNVVNSEILQIAEAVSREKGVPRNQIIDAMQEAVAAAAHKKYGNEFEIQVKIDQNSGEINLYRSITVVEKVEDPQKEVSLEEGRFIQPDCKIGDVVQDKLPPIDLRRVGAQAAKHVIINKVTEVERQKQYKDFQDRKGEVLSGYVKRVEFGNIYVDIGRAEAVLSRREQIPGEIFKVNDRIRAFVKDVRRQDRGAQIILSRTDTGFLEKLFEMEIPEIYEKSIEIRAIAREPGSKAKVAVYAIDSNIDPIGSCVGARGSRINNISNELAGEKVDIVLWDRNPLQLVINSMTPAEILKIMFDEENNQAEVVVREDQLSIAIGRKGQNVRLASRLTGYNIDVTTEEVESKRQQQELSEAVSALTETLGIDEMTAQLLYTEGYGKLEQIADAELEVLIAIEGISEQLASTIKEKSEEFVDSQNETIIEQLEQLGVEQELLDALDVEPLYILKLAEYGVKNLEDLAELNLGELRKIVPQKQLSEVAAKELLDYAKDASNPASDLASENEGGSSEEGSDNEEQNQNPIVDKDNN